MPCRASYALPNELFGVHLSIAVNVRLAKPLLCASFPLRMVQIACVWGGRVRMFFLRLL